MVRRTDLKNSRPHPNPNRSKVRTIHLGNITGNLFIEYEYKDQPSGIAATTADFWALCLIRDEQLLQMYIVPTDTLKRITRRYWGTERDVIGGDLKMSRKV